MEDFLFFKKAKNVEVVTVEGFRQIQHFPLSCRLLGPVLLRPTGVLTSRGLEKLGVLQTSTARFLFDWEEMLGAGSRSLPREYRG